MIGYGSRQQYHITALTHRNPPSSTPRLRGRRAGRVAHLSTCIHVAVIATLVEVVRVKRLVPVQAVNYWVLRVEVAVCPTGRGEEPSDDGRSVGRCQGRRHVSMPLM